MWRTVSYVNNVAISVLDNRGPFHSFESEKAAAKFLMLDKVVFHLIDINTYHQQTIKVTLEDYDDALHKYDERTVYAGIMTRDTHNMQTHLYFYI